MHEYTQVELIQWPDVLFFHRGDGTGDECRAFDLSTVAGRALFAQAASAQGFGTVEAIANGLGRGPIVPIDPGLLLSRVC